MSINRQLLTSKEQNILDLITNQNALISIAFDVAGGFDDSYQIDYARIDGHYIDPMADPNKNRNSRSAGFYEESWEIPMYDILLISLSESDKLDEQRIQTAQAETQPILIKRSNNTFSVYSFRYYDEVQWQERSVTQLNDDEKALLQRLSFDGRILKREDGFVLPDSPNVSNDIQQTFYLLRGLHSHMPLIEHKMDMRTREVTLHKPGQDRFTVNKDKEYKHTPKISMSLPTPDPRYMELFSCDDGVGFLWDIHYCNLHNEKYIFSENGGTDSCFWIDLDTGYDYDPNVGKIVSITSEEKIAQLNAALDSGEIPFSSVAGLREKNLEAVKNKKPIFWNELVVGAPKGIVHSIFATQDKRISRLRALKLMQHTKEKLNLPEDLPLFINQPYYGEMDNSESKSQNREAVFRFYQEEEQKTDIASENIDRQIEAAFLEVIKNQKALAVTVSDNSMIDKYLDSSEKVDATLLPTEPQWMNLLDEEKPSVGLIWDMNTCTLDDEARAMIPKLEAQNNAAVEQHKIIDRNTLKATLPSKQITALFCYYVGYSDRARLNVINMAAYIKEKLGLSTNIPIINISKELYSRLFTDLDQLMALSEARWNGQMQKTSLPRPLPPQTAHQNLVEKRKAAVARFFAKKPQAEDQDWIHVSQKDYEENDNSLKPGLLGK